MKHPRAQFEFDEEFQQAILQYTVTDRYGYKALELYSEHSFTLIEHQVIAKALKTYYKHKKKIPQDKIYLKEELRLLFNSRDYSKLLTQEDKENILKITNKLFTKPIRDGEEILEATAKFQAYINLKEVLENFNLTDFSGYESLTNKIQKAINISINNKSDYGTLFIEEMDKRHNERHAEGDAYPYPFKQLNILSSSHRGHDKGVVIVIIAPEKQFKTGALVNIARSYLKRKKKILYIDFENGQNSLALRMEQSLIQKPKHDIIEGLFNDKASKIARKYKRLGAEIDIKRFPAYSANCLDIESYCNKVYRESGRRYDLAIFDYPSVMGSINGDKDDTTRINNVYIDIKNLVERMDWEVAWCAAHVTREGKKRIHSKYEPNDTAKCIDINRHVDAMFGLNYSDGEKEAGVIRLELIQQRDGIDFGRALFWIKKDLQYMEEFKKSEIEGYNEQVKKAEEEEEPAKRRLKSDI